MKSTGIVRRIDDLGCVVIPKEIRRTMNLREGDPLEIYLEQDAVCFKKYDIAPSVNDMFNRLGDSFNSLNVNYTELSSLNRALNELRKTFDGITKKQAD